ncbi:MAG: hypothetical protein Q8R00_04695 [Candidatus Nanoarchaeia archaeon]|nr:hypothetical protein [Candidatus Nanoarchaeia archaeon]
MIKTLESISLPKERQKYLLEGKTMQGQYLSECLESCRWGSQTTCMWEMTIPQLVDFIDKWKKLNDDNIENRFNQSKLTYKIELPHIDQKECHNHNNKGTKYLDGTIRCTYVYFLENRSFFEQLKAKDPYTQTQVQDFIEQNPILKDLLVKTKEGYIKVYRLSCEENEILKELAAEFQYKVPNMTKLGYQCKEIISDKALSLSLETIITRLKLPPSAPWNYKNSEFPFGGITLAGYVEKWIDQKEVKLRD